MYVYTFQEGRKVYIFSNTLVSEVLHVVMSYMQFTRTRYLENESRGYIQVHLYTCLIQDDFGYLMEKLVLVSTILGKDQPLAMYLVGVKVHFQVLSGSHHSWLLPLW